MLKYISSFNHVMYAGFLDYFISNFETFYIFQIKMINLQKKLQMKKTAVLANGVAPDSRVSIRDKLLVRGMSHAYKHTRTY